jgi:hypothetical protein
MKVDAIIRRLEKDGWKVGFCTRWMDCEERISSVFAERGLTRVVANSYNALYRKIY